MSTLLLDDLFNPPKIKTDDRVATKDAGKLGRKRGTVVSAGGWFAVISWDGNPKNRREYIPDLTLLDTEDY